MKGDRPDAVFLFSDYGYQDEFAGVMRAVVQRRAPGAPVVDVTHGLAPFDVRAGAFALARSVVLLGPGVVIAVVDPGVGGKRRRIAVSVAGFAAESGTGFGGGRPSTIEGPRHLVGPDNGVLGWAIDALGGATGAVALAAPSALAGPVTGSTFDGRDVFAPVAARLWGGASLHDVGLPIDPRSLVRLAEPVLRVSPATATDVGTGYLEAEVLWVDRFGNVQLAAGPEDARRAGLGGAVVVDAGSYQGPGRPVTSFAALEADEVGLLVDANGRLALVCNRRAAATVLGVRPGEMVTLRQVRS